MAVKAKKPRVRRTMSVTFAPSASCQDCSWNYPTAHETRDQAKWHAQANNHTVTVEILTQDVYQLEEQ